jgi:hypothetical protein
LLIAYALYSFIKFRLARFFCYISK